MDKEELRRRTKDFALRVFQLVRALPSDQVGKAVGMQLVRSGTSVGANYRASQRGRSRAEWISKVSLCLEEADESAFWLELIVEGEILPQSKVLPLLQEANELTTIFAAAIKTAQSNHEN